MRSQRTLPVIVILAAAIASVAPLAHAAAHKTWTVTAHDSDVDKWFTIAGPGCGTQDPPSCPLLDDDVVDVTFTNSGKLPHGFQVHVGSFDHVMAANVAAGATTTFSFTVPTDAKGIGTYACPIHPSAARMQGNIPLAHALPVANFTFVATGNNLTVDAGAPQSYGGKEYTLRWDWGDGSSTNAGWKTTHGYPRGVGVYQLALTVTDDIGQKASKSVTINIGVPTSTSSTPSSSTTGSPTPSSSTVKASSPATSSSSPATGSAPSTTLTGTTPGSSTSASAKATPPLGLGATVAALALAVVLVGRRR